MCQKIINWIVRLLTRLITAVFFKQVGSFGTHAIPKSGPIIFVCAPHANQFLDPLIVQQCVDRPVGFLAAQKSVDRKYIGKIIRAMNSIGVKRSQDYRKVSNGTVVSTDLNKIVGTNTMFLRDFVNGESIFISNLKKTFRIAKVKSNTELLLKDSLEKVLLDASSYKSEPKLDQSEVFERVWATLARGECIGIFPEGGSHDRTSLLPLKAGVTIMALGAMAKNPDLNVTLIPVGLNYFHAHRFRSQAYADFGAPFNVDRELVEKFKVKETKREACQTLLSIIQKNLSEVTINVKDHEIKSCLIMARRLYKPDNKELPVDKRLELNRRFAIGLQKYENDKRLIAVIDEVRNYRDLLKANLIRDYQVERMHSSSLRAGLLLCWRIIQILILFPLGLPGAILYLPVAAICNHISKKKALQAVAGSNVKVYGKDVLATWKVMVAAIIIPLVTLLYVIIFTILLVILVDDLHTILKIILPIISVFLFPLLGFLGTKTWERGIPMLLAIRPLFWSTFTCCSGSYGVKTLKQYRDHLQGTILKLVEELGPEFYGSKEKFEKHRIVQHADYNHKFSIIQMNGPPLISDSQFTFSDEAKTEI